MLEIKAVIGLFPEINFHKSNGLSWNPETLQINYPDRVTSEQTIYGLMHEIAHAKLGHTGFAHDIELLKMERDAWDLAKELAKDKLSLTIDNNYAEDCLDTYRDWLYLRSKCPKCQLVGFQVASNSYSCPHCLIDWKVPESRLCAVKRKIQA